MTERDMDKSPYSADEARVAKFLFDLGAGGGDDPIGFILASHATLAAERNELQRTFDLRWSADQRAIKRWRAAHPGNELTWPDHADLVVWLLEELAEWKQAASVEAGLRREFQKLPKLREKP